MAFVFLNTDIEFRKFMDKEHPLFVGFPETNEATALDWANAINEGAKSVVPISLTADLAKLTCENILKLNFEIKNGILGIPLGFAAYALELAKGMQPAFSGVPPPAPIPIQAMFVVGLAGGSNDDCINVMMPIIESWFKLGTAINNGSGATVNWS